MNEKLIWHTVADDDLKYADQVCEFLQNNFQPIGSDPIWFKDYFKWKLSTHNPAGRGYLSVGFEGDKIISCISLVKRKIYFGGQTIIGAEFGDAYCSADFFNNINNYAPRDNNYQSKPSSHYLNRSVFGRIADEITIRAINDGIYCLYGLPNENAYTSWVKRLGHFEYSDHNIFSLSRQTGLKRINNSRFAKGLKGVGQIVERFNWRIRALNFYIQRSGETLLDESFPNKEVLESIWSDQQNLFDFGLIRDYDYWKHRYVDHPLNKYRIFSIMKRNEVLGLFVTTVQKVSSNSKVLFLVDWMIKGDVRYDELLTCLIQKHSNENIDFINVNVLSTNAFYNTLKDFAFEVNFKVRITFRETVEVNPDHFHPKNLMFYLGNTDAV